MKKSERKNSSVHKCAICPYSSKILQDYKRHKVTHSVEKPFKCPECPFTTKWRNNVQLHLRLVHQPESRPFPCSHPGCNYAAKERQKLVRHSKIHSAEKTEFSCSHPNCSYTTDRKGTLSIHTQTHTGEKPFVCQFESCSYATVRQSHLVVHSRIHTKEKPYKCPQPNCEYSGTDCSALRRHQLNHEPREGEKCTSFKCPSCEYSTRHKSYFSKHMKHSHTLDKPFTCSFDSCEYRGKTKGSLSLHLKIHSEERRYKCQLCPFRGKTRNVVTSHLKHVHSDRFFRPFKCPEPKCENAFKRNGDLKRHLLIHIGEKNDACSFPDCSYRGIDKFHVKSHEYNIHTLEKKEKCPLCGYSCKIISALTIHMRTHTKEEPYKCKEPNCEYRAKRASTLKRHQNKHHSLIPNSKPGE